LLQTCAGHAAERLVRVLAGPVDRLRVVRRPRWPAACRWCTAEGCEYGGVRRLSLFWSVRWPAPGPKPGEQGCQPDFGGCSVRDDGAGRVV